MIVYIHGFGSTGVSSKVNQIRAAFPHERVEAPTMPFDPFESIAALNGLITDGYERGETRFVLVGTSLGAFYALNLAATRDVIAVVVNPALKPDEVLLDRMGPNINHVTGEFFSVSQVDLDELKQLRLETERQLNMANVHALVALDDEVLDVQQMLDFARETNSYTTTSNGGHRFDQNWQYVIAHIQEALDEIHVD